MQANSTGKRSPSGAVRDRYGVCDRTIKRWRDSPKMGFPQPISINGRDYYSDDELDAFDRDLAARKTEAV